MRGIRFSVLLALPFVIGALYTGVQLIYLEKDEFFYWFIVLLAILLAILFASNEINYWYDKKYPPHIEPAMKTWLSRYFPYYNSLEIDDKPKFESRLSLYLHGRAFKLMLKEKKNIPEDFKGIIAAHGIQMSMGKEDFLLKNYERVICYNHPFPTPRNQFLHTVETHHEDGVILLSIEQLMQSIGQPKKMYNIAYHAYAEIMCQLYPELANLKGEDKWTMIEQILPYDVQNIHKVTGYEHLDIDTVSLAAYFIARKSFEKIWPDQATFYRENLNL